MFNITGRIFIGKFKGSFFSAYLSFRLAHVQSVHACRYARKKKTNLERSLRGKSFTGHIDSSFSARVTRFVLSEAQIDILNYPVTTSTHAYASSLPPVMSVRTVRCTVHVWRYRDGPRGQ